MEQYFKSDLKYPVAYNVDAEFVFREFTAAAISATTSTNPIKFKPDKNSRYKIVVQTAAQSGIDGSNYWDVTVQADTSSAFGSPVTLATYRVPAVAQTHELPLTKEVGELLDPGATHLRVTATKTGTAGNLSFGAFLTTIF